MFHCFIKSTLAVLIALQIGAYAVAEQASAPVVVDFNRDIRAILSNKCFACHGPDTKKRESGLRLDTREGALAETDSGARAIVPGETEHSELVRRITADDEDERMPPADSGKKLAPREIELLTAWIRGGAPYAKHWAYVKPQRPPLPDLAASLRAANLPPGSDSSAWAAWPRNEIDHFILDRLLHEGLAPTPAADRYALIRRVSLDLTGLPPTLEEVDRFVQDSDPNAYERLVDRLLAKEAYGEHWARNWLDLARYADSSGYADDPPRTIWGFRDYVIRALNENKPFDQFTIEQIAGDLLPDPTDDQLVATAFHRNTLTNNEGGTNDEEYRNVAIVDRVNTTMAVWMGTTIACAQCHNHKYDPITQEDYFSVFAVFNNTEDADRRDESPLTQVVSGDKLKEKAQLQAEIDELENKLNTPTPEFLASQVDWEQRLAAQPSWRTLQPAAVRLQSGAPATVQEDGSVLVAQASKTDVYTLDFPLNNVAQADGQTVGLTAIRIESLPHDQLPNKGAGHGDGNFVVTRVLASLAAPEGSRPTGRYVRIENSGAAKLLSLAEVQVFSGADNIARQGKASQSSTDYDGPAHLAVDGNTDGNYLAKSVTHTATEESPWWEVDLTSSQPVDRIVIWNRTDGNLHTRLKDFRISLLNEQRQTVWEQTIADSPNPSGEYALSGVRAIKLSAAYADFAQDGFAAQNVLDSKDPNKTGWAVAPEHGKPHALTLIADAPVEISAGAKLTLAIEQLSQRENHTLGHFRVAVTADRAAADFGKTPAPIRAVLQTAQKDRSDAQRAELTKYYLTTSPKLKSHDERLAGLKQQLAAIKPDTTVPIMRELPEGRRRTTHIQHRGSYLDKGQEVMAGVPAAIHPLPADQPANRLTMARWLVDENNPLTSRVLVNRYWELIYGRGIVPTSEEFGTQGELPSHPQLLDWLATELVRRKWDMKGMLKLLVTSAAYRQSSQVTPELWQRDPENVLLARGPRFRLSAEMIRDQALAVSGLLSSRMYGPPARPPQPALGLKAAFGGDTDWQASQGEDRYRRGLYTTWRRSNPYPSMATFDAPNREVCTIRRARTNTPLQALVTLNDPVYVEAAQALARRMIAVGTAAEDKARYGFRLCLAREPNQDEQRELVQLFERAHERLAADPDKARRLATLPLGDAPAGVDVVDLAAWTVVGNVLLNLDEMFMKR